NVKDYFFEKNLKLAYFFANKNFINPNMPQHEKEEILSEALVGLTKAFNKFNLDNGARFTTFAEMAIRNEILKYFRDYKNKRDRFSTLSLSAPLNIDSKRLTIADMIEEDSVDLDTYASIMSA